MHIVPGCAGDVGARSSFRSIVFAHRASLSQELEARRRQGGENYLSLLISVDFVRGLMRLPASSHLVSVDMAGTSGVTVQPSSPSLGSRIPGLRPRRWEIGSFLSPACLGMWAPQAPCLLLPRAWGPSLHPKLLCLCKMFSEKLPTM